MGQFLRCISFYIQKALKDMLCPCGTASHKSSAELSAADLTWKQFHKSVSHAAKKWYADRIEKIQPKQAGRSVNKR